MTKGCREWRMRGCRSGLSRIGVRDMLSCNRSCRLAPAHQGMKIRSCDLVWRVGTVDSATPHPDPSGGQAPALHFLIPPSTIGLQFGTFRRRRAGTEGDWRAHPGSESGTCFRANRSCRLAPAHQGMKIRSCDLVWRVGTVDSATPHPDPCGGQAPALFDIFSFRHRPSVYNSARFAGGEPGRRAIGGRIPDRSPGHAFVPMTSPVTGRRRVWVNPQR